MRTDKTNRGGEIIKRVAIIGTGMGPETLTAEALDEIRRADAIIGARRLTEIFKSFGKPAFAEYEPRRAAQIVEETDCENFCALVSGDAGFYSAAEGLRGALEKYSPKIFPGVSSLNYFFARLKKSWSDVKTISRHGREANLTDAARRNRSVFILTGNEAASLGEELTEAGFGELDAFAGENLGLPDERISALKVSQIAEAGIGKLSVLLIENPNFDPRIRFGIPDEEFIRGSVPMTKSEIRAVTLSKLALAPNAVCCDVGSGSGSVTVEMALAAYEGKIFALDKNEEAIRLTMANCRKFRVGNVTPICKPAPQCPRGLPRLDAAFIGGSQGATREITDALFDNNPRIKIVINAVTLETLFEAKAAFDSRGAAIDIVQISAARAKPIANFHMLQPLSPVFIISGGQNE